MYVSAITSFVPYQTRSVRSVSTPKSKPKRITPENYLKYYYDIPFEGNTSAGKPLRRLTNITCPYRGTKIIPASAIKGFEKNLAKCVTAEDCVKLLSGYVEYMMPVEKSMYAIFRDFTSLNPNDNLQNCLQMLYNSCLTKLKLEEFSVLDDVNELSKKLSQSTALKLRKKTTRCSQVIIENDSRDTFKRKIFLESLNEIVPKENEREIFNDIKNKALFLPTSESSKNAFVVKYANRSQTEMTRRLFIASTGTIEHITPASLGGLNTIGNFLFTTANGNRYRENMPIPEYIKRFPNIPKYMQMYMDDIIEAVHSGKLEGNETYPYKIKKKMMEASDGRIMISLSKYKYSEQAAAEAVREFNCRWDKYKKKS